MSAKLGVIVRKTEGQKKLVSPGKKKGSHYRGGNFGQSSAHGSSSDGAIKTDDVTVEEAEVSIKPEPSIADDIPELQPQLQPLATPIAKAQDQPLLAWRSRLAIVVAFAVFLSALIAGSPMRGVGDGGEYVIMADKLAHFQRPNVAQEEFKHYTDLFAQIGGYMGIGVAYRIGDPGPFEFNHFWAYPATVAPAMRVAEVFGWNPIRAFTLTNMALMLAALWVVLRRLHWAPTLLVFAGPAIWWIDKPHSEVFTFSLLAAALALLKDKPIIAMLLTGVAAAHNFPIGMMAGLIALYCIISDRSRLKSVKFWMATVAAGLMSIASPLYFKLTIDTTSPQSLNGGVNPQIPGFKQYILPLFDLNNGVAIAAPVITLAAIASLVLLAVRYKQTSWLRVGVIALSTGWFLFSFAQTGNFNHGATPSMTRYGCWLLPMAVLIFMEVQRTGGIPKFANHDITRTGGLMILGVSAIISIVAFHPKINDGLHKPTAVANWVWNNHPNWDNPVVEVFWERTSQFEGAAKPTANAACTKVLEVRGKWPESCGTPPAIPEKCLQPAANACYANRKDDGWTWVQVSGVPGYDTVAVDVGDIQQRLKKDGVSRID